MYEGEVTELTPTEAENPLSGYGKTVSHVIVGLKTVKGTKQLRLGHGIMHTPPSINHPARQAERIATLDIVREEFFPGGSNRGQRLVFALLGAGLMALVAIWM